MKASYENAVGIIRAGNKHTGFGSPYTFSCVVVSTDFDTAFIKGAIGYLGREEMRAIVECLKQAGFKFAEWERTRKNGSIKLIKVDLYKINK